MSVSKRTTARVGPTLSVRMSENFASCGPQAAAMSASAHPAAKTSADRTTAALYTPKCAPCLENSRTLCAPHIRRASDGRDTPRLFRFLYASGCVPIEIRNEPKLLEGLDRGERLHLHRRRAGAVGDRRTADARGRRLA